MARVRFASDNLIKKLFDKLFDNCLVNYYMEKDGRETLQKEHEQSLILVPAWVTRWNGKRRAKGYVLLGAGTS